MDPQSPPKRMTRARAAKAESTGKATRIVTAAAKARATRNAAASGSTTASRLTTATKRKTRSDDVDGDDIDNDELAEPAPVAKPSKPRGRPRKAAGPETIPEPRTASARTRAGVRKVADEPPKQGLTRATRATRARRARLEEDSQPEPEKKTARTRAASSAQQPFSRTTARKTVKFEEPEKENIAPTAASRGKAARAAEPAAGAGLRARPVRRPAGAGRATRTTKTSTAAAEKAGKPVPLSPKKATQIALNSKAAESEDELAPDEDTLASSRARRPAKLPVHIAKPDLEPSAASAADEAAAGTAAMLASPCRRPPASPWKDAMRTPARRVEPASPPPRLSTGLDGNLGEAAVRMPLLQSPAKRLQLAVKSLDPGADLQQDSKLAPPKCSLMSPAKRPLSPFKIAASPRKHEQGANVSPPAMKPTLLATPLPRQCLGGTAEEAEEEEDDDVDDVEELHVAHDGAQGSADRVSPAQPFPGRLSAVLPRCADPTLVEPSRLSAREETHQDMADAAEEPSTGALEEEEVAPRESGGVMHLDNPEAELGEEDDEAAAPAPCKSPEHADGGVFGLRERDLEPYCDVDSESDDEMDLDRLRRSPSANLAPATPCPAASRSHDGLASARSCGRGMAKRPRVGDRPGFTPLVHQLSAWRAGESPAVAVPQPVSPDALGFADARPASSKRQPTSPFTTGPPAGATFFEEALPRNSPAAEMGDLVESDAQESVPSEGPGPGYDDIPATDVSSVQARQGGEAPHGDLVRADDREGPVDPDETLSDEDADETLSDDSQEYGDENAVPADPSLLASASVAGAAAPVTPRRTIRGDFHTVSKIPIKPADHSTPRRQKKRYSLGSPRLPSARPTRSLTRNATVISYSPTKDDGELFEERDDHAGRSTSASPSTPTKLEPGWSTAGTPARTPRRDLNPALLRGAVVFVDVHTSEGADASSIFAELLGQMGARCVKSWTWNPSSPPGPGGAPPTAKVGITHVVYKDGGKRTLEKVRESGGVVQCVGVSWVLDCERENEWLDESPYYIDTSLVPRGGARRRKSMEPQALSNLDGVLVATPSRGGGRASPARECYTTPRAPRNRRDSGLWARTPEDDGGHPYWEEEEGEEEQEQEEEQDDERSGWGSAFLTPVPKTPAPEAVARYAANVGLETPSAGSERGGGGGDYSMSVADEELLTRTCPPKPAGASYRGPSAGFLTARKDERVLMRLMAARRKSLQFAPKVASPLSKAWF